MDVWTLLSEFWTDNELQLCDLLRMADRLARVPYSAEDLDRIYAQEVAPAFFGVVLGGFLTAGMSVPLGYAESEVERRVQRWLHPSARSRWNPLRLAAARWGSAWERRDWNRVLDHVRRLRGETAPSPRERWRVLWRALEARIIPEEAFGRLCDAYGESHRAYHTFEHVLDCLGELDRVASRAGNPHEIECALWFHDAVYDPRRDDNEQRSADWAADVLLGCGVAKASVDRIRTLVLVTRHDAFPATDDEARMLDIDLSILGADAERFAEYEDRIRSEYDWVPPAVYHRRRAELLEEFLAREPLYRTEPFRSSYEERARTNLRASIAAHRAWEEENG